MTSTVRSEIESISVSGLKLGYVPKRKPEKLLLDGVSFTLLPGEVCTLYGPNGVGKSSLLKFLAGFRVPEMRADRSRDDILGSLAVGYVPQEVTLSIMGWLSGLDNIALPHVLAGMGWPEARAKASECLEILGDSLPRERLGHNMSGGERQAVVLLRELCRAPTLLLIDEGFSSIDANKRTGVMEKIRAWCKDSGRYVLAVSHHAREAILFSDRILIFPDSPPCKEFEVRAITEGDRKRSKEWEEWLRHGGSAPTRSSAAGG